MLNPDWVKSLGRRMFEPSSVYPIMGPKAKEGDPDWQKYLFVWDGGNLFVFKTHINFKWVLPQCDYPYLNYDKHNL